MRPSENAISRRDAPPSGHPALDFLNTQYRAGPDVLDVWQSDADVADWLRRTTGEPVPGRGPAGLLARARRLRDGVRKAVAARKAGGRVELADINAVLSRSPATTRLAWDATRGVTATRHRPGKTADRWLAPVAESAADLLTRGDFGLVRQCQSPACVLWFYDRTKSHRRRWCSMTTCGNRQKVAAFRKRAARQP